MKKKTKRIIAYMLSAVMAVGSINMFPLVAKAGETGNLALSKTVFSPTEYHDNGQWNLQALVDGKKDVRDDYITNAGYHSKATLPAQF